MILLITNFTNYFISKVFISKVFISKMFISKVFISKIFISKVFISKVFKSRSAARSEKWPNLQRCIVNYDRKKFYNAGLQW